MLCFYPFNHDACLPVQGRAAFPTQGRKKNSLLVIGLSLNNLKANAEHADFDFKNMKGLPTVKRFRTAWGLFLFWVYSGLVFLGFRNFGVSHFFLR